MAVLVFANGDIDDKEWIRPYLARAEVIIAADGGSRHLLALGRLPDIIVGDLDSIADENFSRLPEGQVAFIRHSPDKDETDLELALLYAVEHYQGEILIFGALGGRLDQTLANILLLAHPQLAGRPASLLERYQQAWLVDEQIEIEGQEGDMVSLIPLGGPVKIRETRGLKWPLYAESLAFGPARGISNVMKAARAFVAVEKGRMLCVHIRAQWQR